MTELTVEQRDRLAERFHVAEEYIRLRDVIRIYAEVGLEMPMNIPLRLREMEQRLDELAPRIPRPRPTVESGATVRFPEWVR